MTPTDCVRKALDLLCERAGVDPADGSHEAGERVRAWYSRGWTDTGDAACPHDGPLGRWLRRVSCADEGGFHVLALVGKVLVTPRDYVHGQARQYVAMPAAVVAAVKLRAPVRGGVGTPAFRWELARNKEAA